MLPAAGASRCVQVMLNPLRRRLWDLQLLVRVGHPEVPGGGQVRAARARTPRVVIAHLIGVRPSSSPLPAHPAAYPACAFPPAPAPAAACAAACGRAGHPMTGASTSSRCCGTSHAPAGRPAPAAPPPRREAKLPPHHGPRSSRNPGQQGADRTQAMIIQSRPAVSKTTRWAGLQQSHAAPAITHRQQNRAPFQGGECLRQICPAKTPDLPGQTANAASLPPSRRPDKPRPPATIRSGLQTGDFEAAS